MKQNAKKGNLFLSQKLQDFPDWRVKQSGRWLTKQLSKAIEHLPDKEELAFRAFRNCVLTLFLIIRSPSFKKRIFSMHESLQPSKWTTFLDKLASSEDLNILTISLLQTLLQELISRDEDFQPFWKPAFKATSERLLLPTGTDFVALGTTCSSSWSLKQEARSLFSKTVLEPSKPMNKSLQKTYCPSSMSSLADKWGKEAMQTENKTNLKTLRIKLLPTKEQEKILNKYLDTSRYVYNHTLELIKKHKHRPNFQDLRDLLVTEETKKHLEEYKQYDGIIKKLRDMKKHAKEQNDKDNVSKIEEQIKTIQQRRRDKMKGFDSAKNIMIKDFETETPKDIRASAVQRCCDAYKSGFSNLRNGNIRSFNPEFKKKKEKEQSFEVTPKLISIVKNPPIYKKKNKEIEKSKNKKKEEKEFANGTFIKLTPSVMDSFDTDCNIKISKNSQKKINSLNIDNNVDIKRIETSYYLYICVPWDHKKLSYIKERPNNQKVVSGVDLGLRTFATLHQGEDRIVEYNHRADLLKKLNRKLLILKDLSKVRHKQTKKKFLDRVDKKKVDLVDRLHWDLINDLLAENDIIYLGDIKSHNIVKGGKNSILNRDFNDLKFYKFKTRLLYKASVYGKTVNLVKEHNTTKTCSSCGEMNHNVGSSKTFHCSSCGLVTGRDMNACKNMKLKGYFANC